MMGKGLNISETKKELKVGENWQIVTNLISDQEDKTITYTSSNPEIAAVSEDGTVQAKKRGTTQIFVKNAASGYEETVEISVIKEITIHNTVPVYKLDDSKLSDIDKDETNAQGRRYLGQPDMVMLDDNRTLITVYPVGHGHGKLVMKVSEDAGETWTGKTDIPSSWTKSLETPTIYKLHLDNGTTRLMLITGLPNWGNGETDANGHIGGWNTSYSDDGGKTWSEYKNWHEKKKDGTTNYTIVAMASLIQLKDKNGNKIVIPAGFKIISDNTTNNATTVDKGIVIEDSTSGITAGSQFVWIPIGEIIKEDGTKSTISLNRYTFDNDGNPTAQNNSIIDNYYQELDSSNKGNVVAKSISNFKSSVSTNGGFYIGRYEARTSKARASSEDALTPITEIGTEYVYYFITQPQAANLAQNMYNTSTFTSDLINSYAWDTTTLFLQNCSANKKYSTKVSINNIFAPKGTNNINENDIICNIYDISSNIGEWTTETSSNENAPCTRRGGDYGSNDYYITSIRDSGSKSHNNPYVGFRPILYINN